MSEMTHQSGTTPSNGTSAMVPGPAPAPVAPTSTTPTPAAPASDAAAARERKNSSVAWDHFTEIKNPDGSRLAKPRAKCNHCPQTYQCDTKSSGTSNMRNHLLYQCKKCPLFIPNKRHKHLVNYFEISCDL